MKHCLIALASMFSLSVIGSVTVRWTCETSTAVPVAIEAFEGETLDLECTMQSYGQPLATGVRTATLYWTTNTMSDAWWSTNAVVDGSTIRATIVPAMKPGVKARFYFGVADGGGNQYRSNGTIVLRSSPGATPTTVPPPTNAVLNLTGVNVVGAPWATITAIESEVDSRITAATNAIVIPPPPDLSPYATTSSLAEVDSRITAATNSIVIPSIPDLSGYETTAAAGTRAYAITNWAKGEFLSSVPQGYPTETWVANYVASNSPSANLTGYATQSWTTNLVETIRTWASGEFLSSVPQGYPTETWVANYVASNPPPVNFTGYATESWTTNLIQSLRAWAAGEFLTAVPQGYPTETWVANYVASNSPSANLTGYATQSWTTNLVETLRNWTLGTFLTELPDGYATETYADAAAASALNSARAYADSVSTMTGGANALRLVRGDGTRWIDAEGIVREVTSGPLTTNWVVDGYSLVMQAATVWGGQDRDGNDITLSRQDGYWKYEDGGASQSFYSIADIAATNLVLTNEMMNVRSGHRVTILPVYTNVVNRVAYTNELSGGGGGGGSYLTTLSPQGTYSIGWDEAERLSLNGYLMASGLSANQVYVNGEPAVSVSGATDIVTNAIAAATNAVVASIPLTKSGEFNRPGLWRAAYSSLPSVSLVTVDNGVETNRIGMISSNITVTTSTSRSAALWTEMLDTYSQDAPPPVSWSAPGCSLASNVVSATSNGLYRITATATGTGSTMSIDVPLTSGLTKDVTELDYFDDANAARSSLLSQSLADLSGVTDQGIVTNSSGYAYSKRFASAPNCVCNPGERAAGNLWPEPIADKCFISAWHWGHNFRGSTTRVNPSNGSYYTVTIGPAVQLHAWALDHGFTATELSDMRDIGDIAMLPVTSGTVPDDCIPWVCTSEWLESNVVNVRGLVAWFRPQDFHGLVPVVLSSCSGWTLSCQIRQDSDCRTDIANAIGLNNVKIWYPVYGGDSGRPVFIRWHVGQDDRWIRISGFHSRNSGPDYPSAYRVIKAYCDSIGATLKTME